MNKIHQLQNVDLLDVIIIGGSYAGLAAAMALGRSLRNVVVIDSGKPCNRQTPHSHNFLTQDGKTPGEISAVARQQVEQYPTVVFYEGEAVSGEKQGDMFRITTRSGEWFLGKRLIIATGIKDIMPDIEGFSSCWGISIVHCPYCHGYEYRDQKTGIMLNGERAFHLIPLINNLTSDLTVLTMGEADLTVEQKEKLVKKNIALDERVISGFEHEKGQVKKVIFKDGDTMHFSAIYAPLPFLQAADIPKQLGCEITDTGYIGIDNFYRTTVPGVFACGDCATMMRSVANAVAGGTFAGAMVNKEHCEAGF